MELEPAHQQRAGAELCREQPQRVERQPERDFDRGWQDITAGIIAERCCRKVKNLTIFSRAYLALKKGLAKF
ncbi:MAG TPA: hypothetical protein VN673_00190 [Clostridia bacterium]|nr:hypothetical protein [Clostridia bacterium]